MTFIVDKHVAISQLLYNYNKYDSNDKHVAVRFRWLENAYSRSRFSAGDFGQLVNTDVIFGVRSGFISRSVHTRLQGSVCSGCDSCHPC